MTYLSYVKNLGFLVNEFLLISFYFCNCALSFSTFSVVLLFICLVSILFLLYALQIS